MEQESDQAMETDGQKSIYKTKYSFARLIETYWIILFGVLAAILGFLVFYRLGVMDIQPWDEARHGVNAYEMLHTNDFIRSTFQYSTDFYNLKPPLSYWLIALAYRLFGYTSFAMRFPSALSYLITGILVSLSLKRHHGSIASLMSLLFFMLSIDVFSLHMVRTGDADAVFILLYTVAILSTIRYTEREKPRDLYFASLAFALAFLAKSFHAGCIVVTMGILLLWTKKLRPLTLKTWLLSFAFAITPILLWGIARYMNDGVAFLQKMVSYDLVARSTTVLESHGGSFLHYIKGMSKHLSVWILGLISLIALIGNIVKKQPLGKRTALYLIWAIVPILLFFFVKTRVIWYIYPANIALIALAATLFQDVTVLTRARAINVLLSLILISVAIFGIGRNISTIEKKSNQDRVQVFLAQSIDRNGDYFGRNCYINTETWAQDEVLAAELAGDLHCLDGGVNAFEQDEMDALLLVTDLSAFSLGEHPNWEILEKNKYCMLIG
jgi:4-amino-4-deoxy-L-arabinose transferase-like glycosyltransferase